MALNPNHQLTLPQDVGVVSKSIANLSSGEKVLAITGIVMGAVGILALLITVLIILSWRRSERRRTAGGSPASGGLHFRKVSCGSKNSNFAISNPMPIDGGARDTEPPRKSVFEKPRDMGRTVLDPTTPAVSVAPPVQRQSMVGAMPTIPQSPRSPPAPRPAYTEADVERLQQQLRKARDEARMNEVGEHDSVGELIRRQLNKSSKGPRSTTSWADVERLEEQLRLARAEASSNTAGTRVSVGELIERQLDAKRAGENTRVADTKAPAKETRTVIRIREPGAAPPNPLSQNPPERTARPTSRPPPSRASVVPAVPGLAQDKQRPGAGKGPRFSGVDEGYADDNEVSGEARQVGGPRRASKMLSVGPPHNRSSSLVKEYHEYVAEVSTTVYEKSKVASSTPAGAPPNLPLPKTPKAPGRKA